MGAAGVTADDSSGCVRVTADPAGRVIEIEISTSWRAKLGAENVERALVEASLRAGLESARSSSNAPLPRPEHAASSVFEGLSAKAAEELLFQAAEDLRSTRVRVMGQRDRRRALAATTFQGSDERHRVTVTLDFTGAVVSVASSEEWMREASTERLTSAVRDAFESAYDALDVAKREV
jgi:DNA-binding protein YbaB